MAIKRNAPVQQLGDAAVDAAMEEDGRVQARRERAIYQTAGERRRAEKDRKRNRAMFDLPPALEATIDELAEWLGTPKSQVAVYLMLAGLERVSREDLRAARRPSRSMRYEYVLELPDLAGKL